MARFTVSGDSLDELKEAFDELFGDEQPAANGVAPTKRTRRSKAQMAADAAIGAPAGGVPVPTAAVSPALPANAPAPRGHVVPTQPMQPFAVPDPVQPPATQGFDPNYVPPGVFTAPPAAQPDRPMVAKVKEQINILAGQHGEQNIYAWVFKTLALPDGTTKDAFLIKHIHEVPDLKLSSLYTAAGGK